MAIDFESLTLSEIIGLQDELSQVLKRRFERPVALAFSDVVGITPYYERFGNQAGEGLRQRHINLVQHVLSTCGGRLVDTAGDGAFTCFPTVQQAITAYTAFQTMVSESNATRAREHHLVARVGIHHGPVLTDGVIVSGDPVNVCSRVAGTAQAGEIRLTRDAFQQLPPALRLGCRPTPLIELKGISRPVEILVINWRDTSVFPNKVIIEEMGLPITLPQQDLITFGRLKHIEGVSANDIVLALPDPIATQQISRWHFEIRRHRDGLMLRSVTDMPTEVDGVALSNGQERPVRSGTIVKVARLLTLRFVGEESNQEVGRTLVGD